ncbi:fluoride efflux transporter CrcB [Desulfobacterales bacterium HSG16]|nr:fluoride efflux transporter CrcB [Desulfobacterales bacterium HSG16]
MNTSYKILLVMTGGSLGAVSRYAISLSAARLFETRLPIGTFFANMIGCFLIGMAFAMAEKTNFLSPGARLLFMTGFLGALTTFSTYALETLNSLRTGSIGIALINFLVNNLVGISLVLAGMWMIEIIFKGE